MARRGMGWLSWCTNWLASAQDTPPSQAGSCARRNRGVRADYSIGVNTARRCSQWRSQYQKLAPTAKKPA